MRRQSRSIQSSPGLMAIVTGALVAAMVVGCGGGSSGTTNTTSKADWTRQHGAAVTAVGSELDQARTALTAGDRQSILGDCSLLHDDVTEARKGLPVPNAAVDGPLRKALDAVDVGANDCLQGARTASVASITEKAMRELTDARGQMDTANLALAAWH